VETQGRFFLYLKKDQIMSTGVTISANTEILSNVIGIPPVVRVLQ
jgi:hypothetical protein